RPDGQAAEVRVTLDGRDAGALLISAAGGTYDLALALPVRSPAMRGVVIGLRSATFSARDYDRASADGRALGVRVAQAEVVVP
ncbi:MAG: hypothetical protein WCI67_18165, partial [Chloroflexales bacterium]